MWRSLGVVELSRVCLFAKAIPKKLRADRVIFLLPGGLPDLRFVTLADDITCGVDRFSAWAPKSIRLAVSSTSLASSASRNLSLLVALSVGSGKLMYFVMASLTSVTASVRASAGSGWVVSFLLCGLGMSCIALSQQTVVAFMVQHIADCTVLLKFLIDQCYLNFLS
ncbi:hypothetical protein F2Q69_00033322 [Brassica cretica]|uniref:Uncharacterized protein n=1 Tax=Brassica cretica TaxID=69181 RepID=A0A8S9SF30_BRACR|nr:hypothetical protein F2Q69_00033322 [Brassica cretica]